MEKRCGKGGGKPPRYQSYMYVSYPEPSMPRAGNHLEQGKMKHSNVYSDLVPTTDTNSILKGNR